MSFSPTLGRWLTPDPIGYAAGDDNLYRFVENNAVNLTDPSGLEPPRRLLHYTALGKPVYNDEGNDGSNPKHITLVPEPPPPVKNAADPPKPSPIPLIGLSPDDPWFHWEPKNTYTYIPWPRKPFGPTGHPIPACPPLYSEWQELVKNPTFQGGIDDPSVARIFHPGAAVVVRFKYPDSLNSNQCSYDEDGWLITGGPAVGTPDKFSNPLLHFGADVVPWPFLGWREYNKRWEPYSHPASPRNIKPLTYYDEMPKNPTQFKFNTQIISPHD